MAAEYAPNTLSRALQVMGTGTVTDTTPDDAAQLAALDRRLNTVRQEQVRFQEWCDRADLLYYTEDITLNGGADLWASDPSATTPGRSHVSVNTPAVYVDIPASLQAVVPIENMLATSANKEARDAAASVERVYTAWKAEDRWDLKFHKACTVKALYGRTAARVYWDPQQKHPCVKVIHQPRNLWMGFADDDNETVEWAAFREMRTAESIADEFGVDFDVVQTEQGPMAWITGLDAFTQASRPWLTTIRFARIEVWDYWYRVPVFKNSKFVRMETWNFVVAGNRIVRAPTRYPEYKGVVPYVPLFNTYIPGVPNGRPELYDMEQLIREKQEKITNGSQMIGSGTAGDFWQLVGPDAPSSVPATLKPERNKVIAPGAGNRVETIAPFIAQFQLEQFLTRLDREMATVSGLNDLLLGLAPAQVLSSSKAINALISNYESRLAMRLGLLYTWRVSVWKLVWSVWVEKDANVKKIEQAGGAVLDVSDPSLAPRDDMETATRAANLVNAKLWSQRRGMDAVHVDDPEVEQDLIREERTDATLFPADVEVMAQLMGALQSLGLQPNQATQDQASATVQSGTEGLRNALGNATPQNTTSSQLSGDQGETPPIPGASPNAGGEQPPFGQAPQGQGQGNSALLQGRIIDGQDKGRILTQQQLGRR